MSTIGSSPDGLAIDVGAKKLFYSDNGNYVIAVMDLNGNQPGVILDRTSILSRPRAIVLQEKMR